MEEREKKPTEKIVETAGDIVETYRNLITLSLVEYSSLGVSVSIAGIVFLVIIGFFLLFAGVGAAWWIGESMHNMKAGFFLIAGSYAVIFLVLALLARKKMVSFIRNKIIREVYDKD